MARTDQQITTETLRELTYQSPGFWSRMFRRAISSMMPGFSPRQTPLFDRIVGRIGGGNKKAFAEQLSETTRVDLNNSKASDHLLRNMLKSAELLGATAEDLQSINWESLDLRDVLTGDANKIFDFTRIPGLSNKIADIFGKVASHIDRAWLEKISLNYPNNKRDSVQSDNDASEAERRKKEEFDTLFDKLNSAFEFLTGEEKDKDDKRSGGERLFDRLAKMFSPGMADDVTSVQPTPTFVVDDINNTVNQQESETHAREAIDNYINAVFGEQRADKHKGIVNTFFNSIFPIVAAAGRWGFNRLPAFIQRPILTAAGRGGVAAAQAAGQGIQGQINAGAAAMGAARVGVGLKVIAFGARALGTAFSFAIGVMNQWRIAATEAVNRVSQYSGVLAYNAAMIERERLLKDVDLARHMETNGGAELLESERRLIEAEHPFEKNNAELGAGIGAMWNNLKAEGMEFAFEQAQNHWAPRIETALTKMAVDMIPGYAALKGIQSMVYDWWVGRNKDDRDVKVKHVDQNEKMIMMMLPLDNNAPPVLPQRRVQPVDAPAGINGGRGIFNGAPGMAKAVGWLEGDAPRMPPMDKGRL